LGEGQQQEQVEDIEPLDFANAPFLDSDIFADHVER